MNPLHELFMPSALGALVARYAEQSHDRSFWGVYEAGQKIDANVDGTFKWDEIRFSRDLAPLTGVDDPSQATKKMGITTRAGNVVSIKQHVDLPARFLEGFRAPGQEGPDAAAVVANETRNLTNKVMRTLNFWAARSLLTTNGAVDLSAVPNSKILSGTLTYPVQALSRVTTWTATSTKIRSAEINPLRKTYRQKAGIRPGVVLASSTVEGNLTQNTELKEYFAGGTIAALLLQRSFEEGGSVRLGDMDWSFVDDSYFADATPDTAAEVNADLAKMAVLPERALWNEAFALVSGVQFVPNGPAGLMNAQAGYSQVRGFGSYVTLETDPVGLRLHVFWTGMLVQKMVNGVMVYDTD